MTRLTLVLSSADVAATHFMWSPSVELVNAVRLLQNPCGGTGVFAPWVLDRTAALTERELRDLASVVPANSPYIPDFLTPPHDGSGSIESDFALIGATPLGVVREQYSQTAAGLTPALEAMLRDDGRALERLIATLRRGWTVLLEPLLPRLRAGAELDLSWRARETMRGGPAAALSKLHDDVSWEGDRLTVRTRTLDLEVAATGRGIRLVPSLFARYVEVVIDEVGGCSLLFPARGRALLLESPHRDLVETAPLGALLGVQRARILEELMAPRGTTDLARSLGVTAGGVSRHLAVLTRSGLVHGTRFGRRVDYELTSAGALLLESSRARPVA